MKSKGLFVLTIIYAIIGYIVVSKISDELCNMSYDKSTTYMLLITLVWPIITIIWLLVKLIENFHANK